MADYDVVVVGAGNAAMAAAVSAPGQGAYACGEMVSGLFHGNYPGGTGLVSGAVFGRIAGANAAGA
jgi:tricarballylate dehydrogenase